MIKYTVIPSNFEKGKYYPRFVQKPKLREEALIREMARNTALERFDLQLAMEKFHHALMENLLQGYAVKTSLGVFELKPQGTLEDVDDQFRPSRNPQHKVKLLFKPSKKVNDQLKKMQGFRRQDTEPLRPEIKKITNLEKNPSQDWQPGDLVEIWGHTFGPAGTPYDQEEGIFFLDEHAQEQRASLYPLKELQKIIFKIPELHPGTYWLQLRVKERSGDIMMSPRKGKSITIQGKN
jgi:nucleoid DNA-binding protein